MSYWPAWLHRLADPSPWNRFLVSLNAYKYGFCFLSSHDYGFDKGCVISVKIVLSFSLARDNKKNIRGSITLHGSPPVPLTLALLNLLKGKV
jgi:hypothetical protein